MMEMFESTLGLLLLGIAIGIPIAFLYLLIEQKNEM